VGLYSLKNNPKQQTLNKMLNTRSLMSGFRL
jgi:hypothetical protein